jgi:uncharacterized membrane protein
MSPFAQSLPFPFPPKLGISVLLIFHAVGIAGLMSPWADYIRALTPMHLLLCLVVLMAFQPKYGAEFFAFFLLCFTVGFAAEWIGVHTGYLFGDYAYGDVLGMKVDGIPLLIGVNWYLLSYVTSSFVRRFKWSVWPSAILGAALMTGIDFLIEPVAIREGFWHWNSVGIPWTNYACWFLVSLPLQFAAFRWNRENNPMALWLLLSQIAFFGILGFVQY